MRSIISTFSGLGLALLLSFSTQAQNVLKQPLGVWKELSHQLHVTDKFSVIVFGQNRRVAGFSKRFQHLWQSSLHYDVNTQLHMGLGAQHLTTHPVDPLPVPGITKQIGILEYVDLNHEVAKGLEIGHHYRIEQQFIDHWEEQPEGWIKGDRQFEMRFKYELDLKMELPIPKKHPSLYLKAWNDIWLTSRPGQHSTNFHENKAFAGLGWHCNKYLTVEVGYLNVYYFAHEITQPHIQSHQIAVKLKTSSFLKWKNKKQSVSETEHPAHSEISHTH